MMIVTEGSTDVTTYFHLRLAADGTDATSLTISNVDMQYTRSGVAPTAKVDAVALAATDTAHTDNRGIEIDATDQPGLYRFDWPDAAFATGVREVLLTIKVATAFTETLRVQIVSATRGLAGTALPAAAADAAGGLVISDAGGLDADAQRADVAAILVDTGTTLDGRIPAALVSGRMDASVGAMAAAVLTATAIAGDAFTAAKFAADVTTELQSGLATAANLATVAGYIDTEVASILAAVDTEVAAIITTLGTPAGASLAADVAAVKVDTAAILADTGTDGVVVAAASKTGFRLSATGVADIKTTAMTESYAANGAAPTMEQALFGILQFLTERAIVTTTLTVNKLDGTTAAMTFTLDDASNPTAISRTT